MCTISKKTVGRVKRVSLSGDEKTVEVAMRAFLLRFPDLLAFQKKRAGRRGAGQGGWFCKKKVTSNVILQLLKILT